MRKEPQQEISSPLTYSFETETEGAYAITVKASCKPGWRNQWWLKFKAFLEDILDLHLDDEDLRVEIDGMVFKKPKGKKGLFNSPAAFSGTKILGKTKTVIFLLHLTRGSHTIKFIPDGSPYLEEVEITQLFTPLRFVFQPNVRAENEDYYAWYTFALVDQALYSLSLTAQTGVQKEDKDDDDLKILINGEVQKRSGNKHPHSYFCGFSAQGKEETFTKEVKLPKGTHYVELFADKTPWLQSIELTLSSENLPQAQVVWDSVNLREEPKTTSKVLAQLFAGETVEVLERAVQGERPKNEQDVPLFSDRWHKVYYKNQMKGYIYSEALEIEGEDKETIKSLIRQKSKELEEDENLILAIAEKESRFFPYAVGQLTSSRAYEEAGKGVMQINDITAEEIRENDVIDYKIQDIFDIKQNVEGAIRYFKYLRTLYKESDPEYLEKLLISWNCGPNCIGNKSAPIDYSVFHPSVKEFIDEVSNLSREYKEKDSQAGVAKLLLLILGGTIFLVGSIIFQENLLGELQKDNLGSDQVEAFPSGRQITLFFCKNDFLDQECYLQPVQRDLETVWEGKEDYTYKDIVMFELLKGPSLEEEMGLKNSFPNEARGLFRGFSNRRVSFDEDWVRFNRSPLQNLENQIKQLTATLKENWWSPLDEIEISFEKNPESFNRGDSGQELDEKRATIYFRLGFLPFEYKDYLILEEMKIDLDKDGKQERLVVVNNNKNYLSIGISKLLLIGQDGDFLELPGSGEGFNWWRVGDFNQNSQAEIAILYQNSGNGAYNPFYLYEWNGQEFKVLLENKDGGNWDELTDFNGDGLFEIVHTFLITKWGPSWTEVFQWDQEEKRYVKANHKFPHLYEKWLKEEMNRDTQGELLPYSSVGVPGDEYTPKELKEMDLKKSLNECLIEKAILNYNGIFADIDKDCADPYWEMVFKD